MDNPTPAELESFKALQDLLANPQYLVHFDPTRRLYADVDASKAFGIGAVVYHVKDDASDPATADCSNNSEGPAATKPAYLKKSSIEPIMFLSRRLSSAEHQYWPTELEIAGLVWVLRKIRHMVESSKLPVRIFTDHGASLGIAKQSSLRTTSTERSNLQLVCTSEYIQCFNIELYHKEGKSNTIPNALSRLPSSSPTVIDAELDFAAEDIAFADLAFANLTDLLTAYNYTATLVEILNSFKQ